MCQSVVVVVVKYNIGCTDVQLTVCRAVPMTSVQCGRMRGSKAGSKEIAVLSRQVPVHKRLLQYIPMARENCLRLLDHVN